MYIMILHVQGGRKTIKRGAQLPKGRGAAKCLITINFLGTYA